MKAATSIRNAWRNLTRPVYDLTNRAGTWVVSLTTQVHVKAANLWRDLYNPLRGLTMQRAVAYLEEGERGAYADLQWLYRFIEKRDATLRGGKRSLLGGITELDWDIKTVAEDVLPQGYTEAQADAQRVTLRTAYDAITNLEDALEFLALAEFRGFAHLEMIEKGGQVAELRIVEQWYWCRDGLNGSWQYNAQARPGVTRGQDVDLSRFIIREIDDPINEIALLAYVRKQLGRKDEDGYIESFGIPSIFAIMPPNVPQGRESEYQDLAEQVIGDSRGALPHGADIKTVDGGGRGVAPFRAYQEALDKEIVMAITSGQLTMLAQSGTGTLGGGAHSDTFQRVVRALAKRVSVAMRKQFDALILARFHPHEPPLAYFEILANEETDTGEFLEGVSKLSSAGYEVEPGYIKEKSAYPVKLKAPKPAPGAAPALALPNRKQDDDDGHNEPEDITDEFLAAALDEMSAALRRDCKPIAERLHAILSADQTDGELRAALEQLRADLPDLAAKVAASPETVQAWESILAAALGNELAADAN